MSSGDEKTARERLGVLVTEYGLGGDATDRLWLLLELVAASPHSLTTVRNPLRAVELHVADSLAGLVLDEVRAAGELADLGSGAGFPGLVLAVALSNARVTLVESVGKKAEFIAAAADRLGLDNVGVVAGRVESWGDGRDRCDVVTARALAPLPVLLEYAAPLLREGGSLVAWKARPDADEEEAAEAAAQALAMTTAVRHEVPPVEGAQRTLYVSQKVGPTPSRFPRRPGMARKRPLSAST